jgi:selenocysteine lyase/cysteine desulfurase
MNAPMIDLSPLRSQFPALGETDEQDRPYVYFDGPGGTQVPQRVINAMADYLVRANANHGGYFITSRRNDDTIQQARAAMADFLNAASAAEIVFGANMTTLTFSFSRAIGRSLQAGDEIIVTHLDHDGNIAPWVALEEKGIIIRWADFKVDDCRLDLDHLASLLSAKTKLVAVGRSAPLTLSAILQKWCTLPGPGCGWMRFTMRPMDPLMCNAPGVILWYAPHINFLAPMWGCCGGGGTYSSNWQPTK